MSARSFLRRWNLRVLRREWRQYLGVFILLLAGVAVGVAGVLAAHNLVEPPESDLGQARFAAWTDGDPTALAAVLDAGGHRYGSIESTTVLVTGTTQRVAARAIDATNPVTAPLVDLVAGRLPERPDEVAISDRAVDGASVGDELVLGGTAVVVVGLVENPTDLDDEFVVAPDLAALGRPRTDTRFLIDADPTAVDVRGAGAVGTSVTGGPARTGLTLAVNVVSAFGMLEVGLLAGASFAVIARRRMHQFGLLAAAGATPGQLRATATGVGFLLGVGAATVGAVAGIAVARLAVPRMETAVGHRIDFAVPWWAIAINVVVAVAVASLAARSPSRSLATQPVADLLRAQRPRQSSVGRPALTGLVVATVGGAALAYGFAELDAAAAVVGVVLAPIGLLLMAPLVVGLLARATTPLPLAFRLAGRSVGRHNRRSAAVVAALALALAIPVGMVVVTSSVDAERADQGPNLADNWAIAWQPGTHGGTTWIPAALDADRLAGARQRLAEAAPASTLVPVEVAVVPDGPREEWEFDDIGSQAAVVPLLAGRRGSTDCFSCDSWAYGEIDEAGNEVVWVAEGAWIATPELTSILGVDEPSGVAVAETDAYRPLAPGGALDGEVDVSGAWPHNASVPRLLVSETVVDAGSLERVTIGLLVADTEPLDQEARDLLRSAVGADLAIEFPEPPPQRSGLRAAAITIGFILGLGISLAAVSLFTVELGDDLRVLRTVGAGPRTTRRLAAAVAAIVAVAGAVLALLMGYVALIPLLTARDVDFPLVLPWRSLLALLVAFPVGAAASGWLGGRRVGQSTRPASF